MNAAVTVTTTATDLHTPYDECDTLLDVANTSASATLYVGYSGLTTANGTPVLPGTSKKFLVPRGSTMQGRVASATLDARVVATPVRL